MPSPGLYYLIMCQLGVQDTVHLSTVFTHLKEKCHEIFFHFFNQKTIDKQKGFREVFRIHEDIWREMVMSLRIFTLNIGFRKSNTVSTQKCATCGRNSSLITFCFLP